MIYVIYVLLQDGHMVEVPAAEAAQVEGEEVVCRSPKGALVVSFPAGAVTASVTANTWRSTRTSRSINHRPVQSREAGQTPHTRPPALVAHPSSDADRRCARHT